MNRLTCPHCGRESRAPESIPEGAKIRCPGCKERFLFMPIAARPPAPATATPEPRRRNGLSTAAMVLGVVATLLCWIPFVGLLAVPLGLLGFVLGAFALIVSLVGRRPGGVLSCVGGFLSLLAIVLSLTVTALAGRFASATVKQEAGGMVEAVVGGAIRGVKKSH